MVDTGMVLDAWSLLKAYHIENANDLFV